MKIIVAPDSFKGSLTCIEAADVIKRSVLNVCPTAQVVVLPVADGGEGTVDAVVRGASGSMRTYSVRGPLGDTVPAKIGFIQQDTAVIELAQAAGLTLLPEQQRDVMRSSTYGVGEMIVHALDAGCKKILVGVGGSCCNDGGAGLAQAVGVSLKDADGRELDGGGGCLNALASIDMSGMDKRLLEVQVTVACDVTNPLYGARGAARIYGPQKGATPEMVEILDNNLKHYANIIKQQTGADVAGVAGSGAAGGTVAALLAFCGASTMSGGEMVLNAVNFDQHLRGASLVITGEGRIDSQTALDGKLLSVIAKRAKNRGVPVIALGGCIDGDISALYRAGINSAFSIAKGASPLRDLMSNAGALLADTAERVMRAVDIGLRQ